MLDYYMHMPGSTVDRLANAAANKKMEYYWGCDWLHEISVTIRRTKQTNIPNERLEISCFKLEVMFVFVKNNTFRLEVLSLILLSSCKYQDPVPGCADVSQ
jgi:hypothetical protein